MNNKTLAAVSLVAAIPAAVLAFLCIHAFLTFTEGMEVMLMVVNGITLAFAVILVLTPVVIMLRKGKPAEESRMTSAVPVAAGAAAAEEIDADPFDLEAAGSDELEGEVFDDEIDATEEEADLFEFDDEK